MQKLGLIVTILWALTASAVSAQDVAFVNVNVVPMDRERVLLDQSVVVRNGRIAAMGRNLPAPSGVITINGEGRLWLSPGLADMHIHSDTRDDLAAYLTFGVTTVANMGDARAGFVSRTTPAANRGDIPGPNVFNAFVIDGSPDYGHFAVVTPEQATWAVTLANINGYKFVKVYNNLQPDVFAAAAAQAAALGMPVMGHGVTSVGIEDQLKQGQALIAHAEEFFYTYFSSPGSEQTDEPPSLDRIGGAIALVKQYGAAVGADLVTYSSIMRVIGRPEIVEGCLNSSMSELVAPADRAAWRRSGYIRKTSDLRAKYAFLQQMLEAMADAEVELLSGTDAPTVPCVAPGASLHDNLLELEAAGLTRFQALLTATRSPGRFLSRTASAPPSGIVTVGARAELILSEDNPLEDLSTLRRPLGVAVGGRWFDADKLSDLRAEVTAVYNDRPAVGEH